MVTLAAITSDDELMAFIDANDASVMNYFEIFLSRMVMMRQAAAVLGCDYQLIINDVRLS
jgi:hypothetical protein